VNGNDVDAALLRRARRILAVQTTTSIVLSVLVVGVLAVFVVVRAERSALERSLRQTAATEEDVVDPPDGSWIFEQDTAGRITGTKDPPAGLPDRAALDRVRAGGGSEMRQTTVRDVDYVVLTRRRGTETIQVVGSLATLESERNRLLAALAMATAAGLVVALLFAGLLARRATAPLGDALDRQRQFVADASHELRTPLTQLHTRAQLLERDLRAGATSAEMAPDVEQLVAGTRQLGEVVEDLLISSQVPQGAHEHDDVDLGAIAATVVAGLSTRARDQEVELALLPGAEGASVVWGREPALRRVLTALIDNALSHTPAGGHVTVELGTEEAGRWVTAVVRDDGSGFDPADAERIFRRFARGHGDTRRFGLGLALAREVVAGHGGTIDARGRLGEGATFTIRMPAGSARH
jgi:two-component system OmpR family sensor kinase